MNKTIAKLRKKKRHQKKNTQGFPGNMTGFNYRKLLAGNSSVVQTMEDSRQKRAALRQDETIIAL